MSGSSYRADSRPCDASCRRLLGQLDREWPSFLPSFFSRQSVRDCSTTSKGISLWQNGSRSARKDSVSLPHRVHPRHRCHVSRREVLLRQSRPAHQLPLVRVVVLPVGRPRLVARRGLLGRRLATGPASALGGSVCDETRGGARQCIGAGRVSAMLLKIVAPPGPRTARQGLGGARTGPSGRPGRSQSSGGTSSRRRRSALKKTQPVKPITTNARTSNTALQAVWGGIHGSFTGAD